MCVHHRYFFCHFRVDGRAEEPERGDSEQAEAAAGKDKEGAGRVKEERGRTTANHPPAPLKHGGRETDG